MNADAARGTRPGLRPPTRPDWEGPPDALRVVWTRPRATVRWILDHEDPRLAVLLVAGASVTAVVSDGSVLGARTGVPDWPWPIELAVGVLLGVTLWVVSGLVLTIVGRALAGAGTVREVLVAIAWGQVPAAAGFPFAWLHAWSLGMNAPNLEVFSAGMLFLLALWSMVTTTFAVSEAHRFSLTRGLVCTLAGATLYLLAVSGLIAYLEYDPGL